MEKHSSNLQNISVILVHPETPGNSGSIARVMKNFGLSKLTLFNPLGDHKTQKAQGFAMKAKDILLSAEVINIPEGSKKSHINQLRSFLKSFDVVIGTSAKGYSYKNIKRIPVFIDDVDFADFSGENRIAILLGRESTGLTNEEVILTDFLVRIPAHPDYPTLNISQAAGIIFYNIFIQLQEKFRGQVIPAPKEKRDKLLEIINKVIERTPIPDFRLEMTTDAIQNLIGRAFLSKKEVTLLFNLFQKINICYNQPEIIKKPLKK